VLSQTLRYAFRALAYLASNGTGQPILAKEIAQRTNIPRHYLSKILQTLARAGILESFKGLGGGFRIAKPLGQVTLLMVVEPLENTRKWRECIIGQETCSEETACVLHCKWKEVVDHFAGLLQNTTLQDLVAAVESGRHRSAGPVGGGSTEEIASLAQ